MEAPNGAAEATVLHMHSGLFSGSYLLPVYSSVLPMEWTDFRSAIEEINEALSRACPPWMYLPVLGVPLGFLCCIAGMFTMILNSDITGPSAVGMALFACGMVLFAAGGFGCIGLGMWAGHRLRLALCGKLSELNARYASRGVQFELQEMPELAVRTLHTHSGAGAGLTTSGVGSIHRSYHTVRSYSLLVRAVPPQEPPPALTPPPPIVVDPYAAYHNGQAFQSATPSAPLFQGQ
mmetsp:Transcript_63106/g.150442  ORF Transcript_63106/g.150442 Transcript_63106/m.150442 type:complete len:235 (-) Transcript_63106:157-861(-)|eukprot:CAMPEP_0178425506 /NCGR_PEP_ID=MMETSP0689_2-20121128/28758_1 /TAXON_ID=160604 /ORGANISM="Amphidinium massartii, Strain CS-259" /LENGTH=234 /DNA_ID=CAMNT_0020047171 /DNA_START=26 /DNA_END=730 /DNA_ORIENTATION=-